MLLISCNDQQFNTELKSQRYNTLPLSVCTIYQTMCTEWSPQQQQETKINWARPPRNCWFKSYTPRQPHRLWQFNSIMSQWKYWQVWLLFIFVQSSYFLMFVYKLAQLMVMWVWIHSAFMHCGLVICDLLSQKGFSLHECIQCPTIWHKRSQIMEKKYLYFL